MYLGDEFGLSENGNLLCKNDYSLLEKSPEPTILYEYTENNFLFDCNNVNNNSNHSISYNNDNSYSEIGSISGKIISIWHEVIIFN